MTRHSIENMINFGEILHLSGTPTSYSIQPRRNIRPCCARVPKGESVIIVSPSEKYQPAYR